LLAWHTVKSTKTACTMFAVSVNRDETGSQHQFMSWSLVFGVNKFPTEHISTIHSTDMSCHPFMFLRFSEGPSPRAERKNDLLRWNFKLKKM
jgi:hypothetical protein